MPKRQVLILAKDGSPWNGFLREFFEDTPAGLSWVPDAVRARELWDKIRFDVVLADPALLPMSLEQKMRAFSQSLPDLRIFSLGPAGKIRPPFFAGSFETLPAMNDFQKRLCDPLVYPAQIRVLVVDDEKEIGTMIGDFLSGRVNPAFEVEIAENGAEGLEILGAKPPDVLVLDIKMPVKDGREVYRELTQRKINIPVLVFYDAISGDEIAEIRKYGHPAVVEKGTSQSALPEMMNLLKKLVYFQ